MDMIDSGKKWVSVIVAVIVAVLAVCYFRKPAGQPMEQKNYALDYAANLAARGLYRQAGNEYLAWVRSPAGLAASRDKREKVLKVAGDMLLENAFDYEKALEAYVLLLTVNPGSSYKDEIEKKIVICYQGLGRTMDAMRNLELLTSSETRAVVLPSAIVGRIGKKDYAVRDFDEWVQRKFPGFKNLPKKELLQSMMAEEVLARVAEQKGLSSDPEMLRKIEAARKELLVQKILEQEVGRIEVDEMTVRLYYDAHRDEFTEPAKYDVRYIKLDEQKKAVEIEEALRTGTRSFIDAIRDFSCGDTGENSLLRDVTESEIEARLGEIPGLREELQKTAQGKITGILGGRDAFYLFQILEKKPGETVPYEKVKNSIKERLTMQKQQEKISEYIGKLFREMDVKMYPDVLEPPTQGGSGGVPEKGQEKTKKASGAANIKQENEENREPSGGERNSGEKSVTVPIQGE